MSNGNGRGSEQGHMTPTMNAEQFAAYMEKRLTLYDEIELLDREGLELRLRVAGADVAADLGNFYAAYARNPAQLDVVVQTFARAMLGIQPDRATSSFAERTVLPKEGITSARSCQSSTCAYTVFPFCVVTPHGRGVIGPPRVP